MIEPDIARGATYDEQHRHECEMRVIEAMSPERRRTFIAGVLDKRGAPAAERIVKSLSPTALREFAEER